MAMNAAFADVTLVAGAGTGTWRHPDQYTLGAAAEVVALDYVPEKLDSNRLSAGAGEGFLTITATATGVTIASSNVADTGRIIVWATVRVLPAVYG